MAGGAVIMEVWTASLHRSSVTGTQPVIMGWMRDIVVSVYLMLLLKHFIYMIYIWIGCNKQRDLCSFLK